MHANLEVLPAYWGIETQFPQGKAHQNPSWIWKYYPPTGVLKLSKRGYLAGFSGTRIWKYYPPTGVLKLMSVTLESSFALSDLEVLPAYWGIETQFPQGKAHQNPSWIWKYYPPTGVLKLSKRGYLAGFSGTRIWKYYPPTGVLKPKPARLWSRFSCSHLEVLPAYWGIET